jgi:hypothetical protein
VIKQFKMPYLPCPVCGSDCRADKVLRDSEARGAAIEALKLAEDVLSRAPFSTAIWPNGMHPQRGIKQIRDALAAVSSPGESS